jgi:hypothetical protein
MAAYRRDVAPGYIGIVGIEFHRGIGEVRHPASSILRLRFRISVGSLRRARKISRSVHLAVTLVCYTNSNAPNLDRAVARELRKPKSPKT